MKLFRHLFLITFLATSLGGYADHLSGSLLFSARFSGDQEVPPVSTEATGVGGFFINEAKDSLCISISVVNLSGPITGAHIHQGAMGENGPVLVGFTEMVDGNSIQATVTGEDLTPELIEMMLSGDLYFNIHTDANPGGEIRSQIILETDRAFVASLDAEQETAEVDSDGMGLANFNLSKMGTTVKYEVVVDGLSGPIQMAHLHMAEAGTDGPVVVDLGEGIDGNTISGSFNAMDFEGLTEAMMMGNIYINVHTEMFPAGEVRGQLMLDRRISHDAVLNTEQEIPAPMGSMGNGLAQVGLNYTMDTLFYRVQLEGLTGPATGAHFHEGAFGETGPVLIGITDDIDGNRIEGFVTGEALSVENINKFLSGGIYLNIHTDMNAPGEIRGQVYKLAREGYTYSLSGDQEVPAVMTDAYGSGIVSIDRDQSNVHFMMAYNDLSGPQTMAHFHMGAAGENGGVLYGLGSFFDQSSPDDAAFGYWTDSDSETPFTAEAAAAFRNEMVYVNVHTAENAPGEIRGQVTRGLICSDMALSVFENEKVESLTVYPNPATDFVRIPTTDFDTDNIQVRLTDVTGKIVLNEQFNRNSELQLDVSQQTPGIYFVNILGENAVYTTKLVIR